MASQASRRDMMSGGAQATITHYDAESIINWRTMKVGSKHVLSLVVLQEVHEEPDGYGLTCETQYRELALQDGVYTVRIHRETDAGWVVVEEYTPRNASGAAWTEIPFVFIGAVNNDPAIGPIPMYDLAVLNLAHWRNSADYEESAYLVGQPQPWMSGLDETWRDHMEKSGIYLGSRAPWLLPTSGAAGLL
jgi:hypothetical protein